MGRPPADRPRRAGPDRGADPGPPPPADALGVRLRAARSGRQRLDAGDGGRLERASPRDLASRRRPRRQRSDRPRDRGRRPARPGRVAAPRPANGRLAPGTTDPAGGDPDHRSASRRGCPVGRPAQEMAAVRQQGPERRDRGRGRRCRTPAGVLSDLPGDGRSGRLPDPDRGGLPRRVERLRAGRAGTAPVRPDRSRRTRRHALPGPERSARRGAVRRDDRGRRRIACQLPAEMGGDPQLASRRGRRATTCGAWRPAGSPISRPGSADARSATSAPGTSSWTRSDGRPTVPPSEAASGGRVVATAWRRAAVPPPTVRPIERPGRTPGRAGRLGRLDGRGRRRARLPVPGVGRAPARLRLVAPVPGDRRRRPGAALTRPWRMVGGSGAYLPRGPVAGGAGVPPAVRRRSPDRGERGAGAGRRRRRRGRSGGARLRARVRAARIRAAGFHPIEEIQPSRHRVTLPLVEGATEADAVRGDREVHPPAHPRRRARRA